MLVKTMTYTDFDGAERTEDFYFNLTEAEAFKLSLGKNGGYERWIQNLIDSRDGETLMNEFEKIILNAYGKKSLDGRRFVKNAEIAEEFRQTQAFSDMVISFIRDPKLAADFLKGIVPADSAKSEIVHPTVNDEKDVVVV